MSDNAKKTEKLSKAEEGRRRFLDLAGKAAVVAPAASLLLTASTQMAMPYGHGGGANNGNGNGVQSAPGNSGSASGIGRSNDTR